MTNFTMLVCNRSRLTKQALDSLGPTDGDYFNVTISEDRKCDVATQKVLSFWRQSNPKNKHLCGHCAEYGTGSLRNQVIQASEKYFGRGDYLYLSDSDVFFKPDWLPTLIECYKRAWKRGFRVLGGVGHPYHHPIAAYVFDGLPLVHEVLAQPLQSMLMRWEVWDAFGPFNDTPAGRVCMGEDVEFGNKIREQGGKLGVVSPALLVNTGITNTFGEKIPGWGLVQAQAPAGVIVE